MSRLYALAMAPYRFARVLFEEWLIDIASGYSQGPVAPPPKKPGRLGANK